MRLRLALIALSLACVPAFAQVPDRPTYADRCAAEMGRIPAFNCLAGKLLPITVNGVVQTRTVDACDKPVQLKMIDKQCVPFSRIQELNTGRPGVLTLALCRKYFDRNVAKPEANELFDDIAIIQHDSATGRTCFFQSEVSSKGDRGIDGRRVPSPSDRTAAADAVWMTTSRVGNSVECTKCHAADPFVWSPYIAQTVDVDRWDPHGRYDSNFANLFGNPSKTFRPANNACLDCHHFGRGPKPNVNLTDKRKDNACNALVTPSPCRTGHIPHSRRKSGCRPISAPMSPHSSPRSTHRSRRSSDAAPLPTSPNAAPTSPTAGSRAA